MAATNQSSSSRLLKRAAVPLLLLGIVGLVVLTISHFSHKTKSQPATTGNAYTKGAENPKSPASSQSNGSQTGSNSNPSKPSTGQTQPAANLIAPWGTFANVYKAGRDEQMGSTCNTTSGASCQIIFTNGSLTKSLDAQTTDSGGAAYWSWKPSQIGLTTGTWHITAKATLGSQVKTTSNDPLTLEITQ